MSRPSSKFVQLTLGARAVQASVQSFWSRGQALSQVHQAMSPADTLKLLEGQEDAHRPCIEVAGAVLSELANTSGLTKAPLKVQISDALAHFDLIPGDFAESSERQLQAIAEACMNDMLGDDAGAQVVRWQLQADNRHLLIASLPSTVINALTQEADHRGLSLASLQPDFCARWNAHAGDMSGTTAIFASVADGSVIMALTEQGSITALSTGALEDAGSEAKPVGAAKSALDLRADRLAASHGVDLSALTSFVLVAPDDPLLAPPPPRWRVVRLQGASA